MKKIIVISGIISLLIINIFASNIKECFFTNDKNLKIENQILNYERFNTYSIKTIKDKELKIEDWMLNDEIFYN